MQLFKPPEAKICRKPERCWGRQFMRHLVMGTLFLMACNSTLKASQEVEIERSAGMHAVDCRNTTSYYIDTSLEPSAMAPWVHLEAIKAARYYVNRQLDTSVLLLALVRKRTAYRGMTNVQYEALALQGISFLKQLDFLAAAKALDAARALEEEAQLPLSVTFEIRLAMAELTMMMGDSARAYSYLEQAKVYAKSKGAHGDNRMSYLMNQLRLNRYIKTDRSIVNSVSDLTSSCLLLQQQEILPEWYFELALWQLDLNQDACAVYLLAKAYEIALKTQNIHGLTLSCLGKGILAERKLQYKKAIDHYSEALQLAKGLGSKLQTYLLNDRLSSVYDAIQQPDSSAYFKYMFLRDKRDEGTGRVFEILDGQQIKQTYFESYTHVFTHYNEAIRYYFYMAGLFLSLAIISLHSLRKIQLQQATHSMDLREVNRMIEGQQQQWQKAQDEKLNCDKQEIIQLLHALKEYRDWMSKRDKLQKLNSPDLRLNGILDMLEIPKSARDEEVCLLIAHKIVASHSSFVSRLELEFGRCSFQQKFICILVILGLDKFQIAALTATKPQSVSMTFTRLRYKFNIISNQQSLFDFLIARLPTPKGS